MSRFVFTINASIVLGTPSTARLEGVPARTLVADKIMHNIADSRMGKYEGEETLPVTILKGANVKRTFVYTGHVPANYKRGQTYLLCLSFTGEAK